jgi:hypothetical protein
MSLKEMFEIPENHSLVNISYEEKDSIALDGYWTYEERDKEGGLISKIEYWDCVSPGSLTAKNGYRKLDPTGKLIVEKNRSRLMLVDFSRMQPLKPSVQNVRYHLKED